MWSISHISRYITRERVYNADAFDIQAIFRHSSQGGVCMFYQCLSIISGIAFDSPLSITG